LNNYFISPLGDIILLAVSCVVVGIFIQPYTTKLVSKVRELVSRVRNFELDDFYSSQWKKVGNHLGYSYYWKRKTIWYRDDSKIICDSDKDLQLEIMDVRIYLKNELIDDFKKQLNRAIREANT